MATFERYLDMDTGKVLKEKIYDLELLLAAYRTGRLIKKFPVG